MIRKLLFTAAALSFAVGPLSAQWVTESHPVKAGWNAIYLFVDASDVTIDTLLISEPNVEQIWRWDPDQLDKLAIESPKDPGSGAEWSKWVRDDPVNSTMTHLLANYAYLVKVADNAENFTLSIKGKAVMPRVTWRNDGLNLVGFPASGGATKISSYLADSRLTTTSTKIYRYVGGSISNGSNPQEVANQSQTDLPRGEAFWINTGKFSDYYGPIKVQVSLSTDGLSFGDGVNKYQVILTNRTKREITVSLTPGSSEIDRQGKELSPVPLQKRVLNTGTGKYKTSEWNAVHDVVLQGGEIKAVDVVIDRQKLTGVSGTEYSSVLVLTDKENMSSIKIPVSATKGGIEGLWVGAALIDRVQNQLQKFQRNKEGEYEYDENGKRISIDGTGDNSLNKTAQTFPVRLIIHHDETGRAHLLSNVYAGLIATSTEGATPEYGIATAESLLDAKSLDQSVRLTSVHFPLDLNIELNGSFGSGEELTGTVTLDHDDRENPFIHAFHPDHDNLDSRFENKLEDGAESYTVERKLKLKFGAADVEGSPTIDNPDHVPASAAVGEPQIANPDYDPTDEDSEAFIINPDYVPAAEAQGEPTLVNPDYRPEWGSQYFTGTFTEEITGIHKNPLSVQGKFFLYRLSKIKTLHIK